MMEYIIIIITYDTVIICHKGLQLGWDISAGRYRHIESGSVFIQKMMNLQYPKTMPNFPIRLSMGMFILFSLLNTLYVTILFHKMIEGQQQGNHIGSDIFQDTQNNLKLRGLLPPPTHRLDQDGNHITVPKWDEIKGLPPDWETYRYYDLRRYYDCHGYSHEKTKPLPTNAIYQHFRDVYMKVVNPKPNSKYYPPFLNDPVPGTEGYNFDGEGNAQPYHADHGSRGRGLFASRRIRKGELVHDGSKSDIIFPSGMAFRKYLFALSRKEACDMIGKHTI